MNATMNTDLFSKNISALASENDDIANQIRNTEVFYGYSGIKSAKSGSAVVLFDNNRPAHSLYDPEQEAVRLIEDIPEDAFICFVGVGSGYHIRSFLDKHPRSRCLLVEPNECVWKALLSLVDLSDILQNSRVSVCCRADSICEDLPLHWFPALSPRFRLIPLRSWKEFFPEASKTALDGINGALARISSDYSVQAHFGRLWFRNALMNIAQMDSSNNSIPHIDAQKEAVIAAAGPGLEKWLPRLRENRDRYAIFATDTSWGSLNNAGIEPDYFISIDGQNVSLSHVMNSLPASTIVFVDLCANPGVLRETKKAGCRCFITGGGHPLIQSTDLRNSLPPVDTSSGTVALAARSIAYSLGFTSVVLAGADFCYPLGKAYARGTYLYDKFSAQATRLIPSESLWTGLLFRTEVASLNDSNLRTYRTAVLDSYEEAAKNPQKMHDWNKNSFIPFSKERFFSSLKQGISRLTVSSSHEDPYLRSLLPLIAWARSFGDTKITEKKAPDPIESSIILALDMIERYT